MSPRRGANFTSANKVFPRVPKGGPKERGVAHKEETPILFWGPGFGAPGEGARNYFPGGGKKETPQ